MAWVSASTIPGERAWPSKASLSFARSHQHQKLTHTERGNSWGMCAPIPAVVHDKTQDRPVLRAGIKAPTLHTCRGLSASGLSLCRSAAGNSSPHSRRPVLETLLGTGLHFPAERIRAARGGLYSVRVLGSTPSRAQSLAHQQTVNVSADVPHLSSVLSNSVLVRCINKCQQARTNNWESRTSRSRVK